MSLKLPVTAIFDIGKTNKKLLFFDKSLSVVHSSNVVFDEKQDDDSFPCDDLVGLTKWMLNEIDKIVSSKEFEIHAINFSGYGATLVHLGSDGKPVTPLYNYLKPYPDDLLQEFYNKYGGQKQFSLDTASPPLGMLNSGLQLYWLKRRKPHLFQQIKTTLHFPQYLSFLLTRQTASEKTSLGCHTGLWNFREHDYHQWLDDEDLLKMLPEIQPVSKCYSVKIRNHQINTGIGIHDSSAALIPYLNGFDEPFIQLSTGTWSIAMNPFTRDELTYQELKRDYLHYLNIYGKPVKASRFLLGGEYSHQLKKMGAYFGRSRYETDCDLDPAHIQKLADDNSAEKKLILEKGNHSGPFQTKNKKEWDLSRFASYEEAVHQCLLDLVAIQVESIRIAEGDKVTGQIIVTGGFAKNRFFCRLLATMLPDKKIYTAGLKEASALGAALLVHDKQTDTRQLKEMLALTLQKPFENLHIEGYFWKPNGGKTGEQAN